MSPEGLPSESQLRPQDDVAGKAMITRKLTLAVSVLLTIAIASTVTAQAGIRDWFVSNDVPAERADTGSFDSLYASVLAVSERRDEALAITGSALLPMNSPAGGGNGYTLRRTYSVQVSAYNSEVGQTDDSPFITANGTHVRDGIVAANIYNSAGGNIPFNSVIKFKNCGSIPNDKIFVVTDRLNKRYRMNVDIWMESHADALQFGRRTCTIEVIQ
jgi:3D (Asp-Asp-Asp) domain-containing protein